MGYFTNNRISSWVVENRVHKFSSKGNRILVDDKHRRGMLYPLRCLSSNETKNRYTSKLFFMNSFNCSTWDNFVCTVYSTMYIQQRDISPLLETSFFVPLTFFANKYRKHRTKDSNPSHHKKRKCRSPVCSDFEWCVHHRGRDTDDGRK